MIVLFAYIVYCHSLPNINNGDITCTLGDDDGVHYYSYQDACNVTCDTGYTLTGSDTRTCLSNGSWSGVDGTCKKGKINKTMY